MEGSIDYGFVSTTYTSKDFKDDVFKCLIKKFSTGISRGNKSLKITGNSYRNPIDVVPCLRYRDYSGDFKNDQGNYVPGIAFNSEDGELIINFPEQHIKNGRLKNGETNYYYKKVVRIFKKVKSLMTESGISGVDNISSFAIESLLWNIPSDSYVTHFRNDRLGSLVQDCLKFLNEVSFVEFKEANGIKKLCETSQDEKQLKQFVFQMIQFIVYKE